MSSLPEVVNPPLSSEPHIWQHKLTDKYFTRDRLISLAQDLRIPGVDWSHTKLKKARILGLVRQHLTAHPELAQDPRFVGLVVYRTSSKADGTGRGPHRGLTSAGKDAEDAQEQAKATQQTTPAYRALQNIMKTSDPPARQMSFQTSAVFHASSPPSRPSAPGQARNTVDVDDGASSEDSDSDISSAKGFPQDEPEVRQITPPVSSLSARSSPGVNEAEDHHGIPSQMSLPSTPQKRQRKPYNICVRFRDVNGKGEEHEVWTQSGTQVPIETMDSRSGNRTWYTARLSDLIPAALNCSTPLKEKRGRILRPPVQPHGNNIDIGSIAGLTSDGKSKQLVLDKINEYCLSENDDGDLVCTVLYRSEDNDVLPQPTPAVIDVDEFAADATHRRDEVIAKAVNRAPKRSGGSGGDGSTEVGLVEYVRRIIGGDSFKPKKIKNIGDIMERYRFVQGALKVLDDLSWSNTTRGGYIIPEEDSHKPFSGLTFRKDLIYDACGIKRSVATSDAALFRTDEHPVALKRLAKWVKNPDHEELRERFAKMTVRQFVKWKEDHIRERQVHMGRSNSQGSSDIPTRKGKGKGVSKGKAKRSRGEDTDGSDARGTASTSSKKPRWQLHRDINSSDASEVAVDTDDLDEY